MRGARAPLKTIPPSVAATFDAYTPKDRSALKGVRSLIFVIARKDARIGALEETLRWGEPAYITTSKKTGSTIRLGVEKTSARPAVFFNCNTTLVEELREQFGAALRYSKNRALLLEGDPEVLNAALSRGISAALTYHLRRKT